jgi:hypothetical protein
MGLAMRDEAVASRTTCCLAGGLLTTFLINMSAAVAFPLVDPSNQDTLPATAPLGTELPTRDVRGLGNQLRLVNPAAPGNPGAWTIIPRLTIQEMFTDNAFEVTAPRRFDAITVIAPGIAIQANTARLQMNLDYQPNLLLHAINGPLNALTQQLTATGLVTVVPDLAFVDLRAVSGVQSQYGALAGNGTIGNANAALTPAATSGGYGIAGQAGTNPRNEVQTSSIGMSPYLLHQFKDYGTGKIGASIDASHYSTINGFFASPFPTGGTNGQSLLTTEQIAQFTTGEFLGKVQNSIIVDFSQSRSQASGGATIQVFSSPGAVGTGTPTTTTVPAQSFTSQRQSITDQISYALNRFLTLQGSIGEQRVSYSTQVGPQINGLTWQIGFTFTPSPFSALTMSYGRNNGSNDFNVNGYVGIGGRTQLSVSYSDTIGTQLENLQNQLNNGTVNVNGQLVNAANLGPAFVSSNALGLQTGVFRFDTFNAALSTGWLRDTLQANLTWSIQTNLTPGAVVPETFFDPNTGQAFAFSQTVAGTGQSTDIKTASLAWTHELSPDMTLSTSASYSLVRRSGNLGTDSSLSTAVGLQYTLSESTSLSARYSFFDRISKIPGYTLYENILILGVTKQF